MTPLETIDRLAELIADLRAYGEISTMSPNEAVAVLMAAQEFLWQMMDDQE